MIEIEDIYSMQTAPVLEAVVKFATIPDLYHCLNGLLKQRIIGVIIRYGTVDLSVNCFEVGSREWVDVVVENPLGNDHGELRIRVKGFPPILLYKL